MILPTPCPDETFCSVLTRLCRLNGIVDFCDIAPLDFLGTPCVSFIDAEIDFPAFCQRTNNAYGDPVSLLDNMTWLGLSNRLGGVTDEEIREISAGTVPLTLSRLTFADSTALRYCPTCRRTDIESVGVGYWHLIHQLPIVFFCQAHGDRLVFSKIKRTQLHQSFPLPGDCDQQCVDSVSSPETDNIFWQRVSSFAAQFGRGHLPYDGTTIRAAIIDGLQERGLAKCDGLLQTKELVHQMVAQVGKLPADLLSRKETLFAKRIVASINDPAWEMALGRVVLISWLFGKWGDFVERCRWVSVFAPPLDVAGSGATLNKDRKALGEYHKERCGSFLSAHPDGSRLDLTRAEYRSFRWLLHHDPSWLDRLFPVPQGRVKQLGLFEHHRLEKDG